METSRVKRKDSPTQYKEEKRGQRKFEEKVQQGKHLFLAIPSNNFFLRKLRSYLLNRFTNGIRSNHTASRWTICQDTAATFDTQCFQKMFPSTLVHPSQCVNILGGFFNNLSRRNHKGAISSQALELVEHITALLYWGKPQTYGEYKY